MKTVMHASHWGAYRVQTDGQRIHAIEPFEHDPHPSPQIQAVRQWRDERVRITQPMVRQSWLRHRATPSQRRGDLRGQEAFVPVSWDEALDMVAQEVRQVQADHGSASLFAGSYGWCSAGRVHHAPTLLKRVLNAFGGCTRHADTYSIAAGAVMLDHVLGNDAAYMGRSTSLLNIAQHTELLLVFGGMSLRTAHSEAGGLSTHLLPQHLSTLAKRRVRVVLVSPCQDDVPATLNPQWWPIRPGTDTALMLALAYEVVAAGLHDQEFLQRCCTGSEEFLQSLQGLGPEGDGVAKTAEWAQSVTGLPAQDIRALAHDLARQRSFISVSWGLQRAHHGEQPFWAAVGLAAVLGHMGQDGGGMGCGYGSLGGVGNVYTRSPSPSLSAWAAGVQRPAQESFIPVSRITEALTSPGKAFTYRGHTHHFPDIRLVYWAGGNPFHHHQDLNQLRHAWARPQTVVVQDPLWTATARMADIVLPACTSLERNDISGNKRSAHLVAMQQALPPLAQSRSDYAIFLDLAQRLGVGEVYSQGRDEMQWVAHLYEEVRQQVGRMGETAHELPAFEVFWERGWAEVPGLHNWKYLDEFRADPVGHALPTETGRIMLHSPLLAQRGYADCRAVPSWLEPAEWLGCAQPGMFHLLSRQPGSHLHSQLDFSDMVQQHKAPDGREWVDIHPEDAQAVGIDDGALVRLYNERGACLARARHQAGIRRQVLVLPTGAWMQQAKPGDLEMAGNPNVLTPDIPSSAFGQGCSAHTCLVFVQPYEVTEGVPAVEFSLPLMAAHSS